MTDIKNITKFATAYHAFQAASEANDEPSRRVWQDMLVQAADALGIQDSDFACLKDCRDEVKARDAAFLEVYRAQLGSGRAA